MQVNSYLCKFKTYPLYLKEESLDLAVKWNSGFSSKASEEGDSCTKFSADANVDNNANKAKLNIILYLNSCYFLQHWNERFLFSFSSTP